MKILKYTMSSLLLFFGVFFLFICLSTSKHDVTQERARVVYYDPKYVKDPTAFTFRLKRGDQYRSNATVITLHPWGNNVTITINIWTKAMLSDLLIVTKLCDLIKHSWLVEYVQRFMKIKPMCPFPAGLYGNYNVELPPRNFPYPFSKGESTIKVAFSITDTRKLMLEYQMKIYVK